RHPLARDQVAEGLRQERQVLERVDDVATDLDVYRHDAGADGLDDVDRVLFVLQARGGFLLRPLGHDLVARPESRGGTCDEYCCQHENGRASAIHDGPLPFVRHVHECRPPPLGPTQATVRSMRKARATGSAVGLSRMADQLDELAANLLWRIGRASEEGPVTVRVGLASSAPIFNELPRLRSA